MYFKRSAGNYDKTIFQLQDVTLTDFTTCGYLPYTSHNFSVECQPTGLFSGYWSKPVYASILTPMTGQSI